MTVTDIPIMPLSLRLYIAALFWLAGCTVSTAQVTIVDDLQRTVTLPAPARAIVSLAPSITESLFAIGAGDRVVGVTEYCNFPPAARVRPRVGGMTTLSIEAIVALHPDLVVMSMEGNQRDDFSRLVHLGIPVVVTNPRTLEGIYHSLHMLGTLSGQADSALRAVRRLRRLTDNILQKNRTEGVRALLFVSLQPLIAAGERTFIDELLRNAGATNLAARTGLTYPTLSREAVVAYDPDVLFVMSDVLPATDAIMALYPEWSALTCVRTGRVFRLDADIISRPGPRAVDGLQLLFSLLHRITP